jgi:hypothetical protein
MSSAKRAYWMLVYLPLRVVSTAFSSIRSTSFRYRLLEKLLPSASLTLTINGVDYVTSKNIVSLETSWKNNVRMDAGFYPGSGFQTPGDATTGAIRGRLEFGNRAGALKFVARFDHNSTELSLLKAQTTGTAVIHLQFDTNNSLDITWQKGSVRHGGSGRDRPDRDSRGRGDSDLRLDQRHHHGGCEVQRRRYLPVERIDNNWKPQYFMRPDRLPSICGLQEV